MKVFVSILLCALCCMQSVAQSEAKRIYTIDDKQEIVTNDGFVDVHVDRNGSDVKPYELIGQTTFEAHSKEYKLQVLQYKGWQNEGGDFRVIRILHEGKQILEFIDEESWLGDPEFADKSIWEPGITMRSIYSGGSPFSRVLKLIGEHATYTGHCLVYPLENEATALLFEGFCFGNDAPLATIIVIKGDKAKVVFNKSWFVRGLDAHEKNFELYLEDDCLTPRNLGIVRTTSEGGMTFQVEPFEMTAGDTFGLEQGSSKQEKAIKMLSDFYSRYLFGRGTAHFQLDATKYCTPRFLSKLGEDYEKQLQEDYIISQEELGLEWWSFYNFINGYQDGPHDINEVVKVVHEHDNTYRIYFIENGYENHRLIDLVERNDSLFIDDVYRLKFELIDNAYEPVRYYK